MSSAVVLCVYRAANAKVVRRLVRSSLRSGATVRLWALDRTVPSLSTWTAGSGPGAKFALLNRLLASDPIPDDAYVVVADDDVTLALGMGWFLRLARRAAFDIAMPAHRKHLSHLSHQVTLRRSWSLARLTEFVEIGPVFAVSPDAGVLPFPDDAGMGWGLEADWYVRHREGARLGVVDGAPMRHLSPVATGYEQSEERERMAQRLAAAGLDGLWEIQTTLATWRPWQRTPPWLR